MSGTPLFIAGHSLGGARALQYAFSRLTRKLRVDGVYAFAPARPGDNYITECFASAPGTIFQTFRNHRDPVPNLPPDLKLFRERYEQPWHLTELNEPSGQGNFADHHIQFYQAGVAKLPIIHGAAVSVVEAAQACSDLYSSTAPWDWQHMVDGAWWGLRVMPNGARLLVSRGSQTAHDWYDDFDAIQISVSGARISEGFWSGIGPYLAELDAQLDIGING